MFKVTNNLVLDIQCRVVVSCVVLFQSIRSSTLCGLIAVKHFTHTLLTWLLLLLLFLLLLLLLLLNLCFMFIILYSIVIILTIVIIIIALFMPFCLFARILLFYLIIYLSCVLFMLCVWFWNVVIDITVMIISNNTIDIVVIIFLLIFG